jgi:hypothetical protein
VHRHGNYYGELALRVFGIFMAAKFWADVVFRRRVRWKGGDRAPLSLPSKVVFAIAMSAWCLAAFGVYPMYGAAVFAVSIGVLFPLAALDRRAHRTLTFAPGLRPEGLPERQQWLVFCFFDALTLTASGVAMIRDFFSPPVTDEQHIVHVMALGMFAISVIGAIALFVNRPRKDA